MSAKELIVFIPEFSLDKSALTVLAEDLSLNVDVIPTSRGFSFDFSAQKGAGKSRLAIEHKADDCLLIREIMDWTRPSASYKSMLGACKSTLTVYYRDPSIAKDALRKLGEILQERSSNCIVDNGFGCLLNLDVMLSCIDEEPQWSWEKEQFPELEDVADSEWK